MAIVAATATPKVENKANKLKLDQLRRKHAELVRGKFRFLEVPNGIMRFNFKEFLGDKNVKYEFEDGKIYTIPRGVAKHLNKNCWYPVHEFAVDEEGNKVAKIGTKIHRCVFESLEFVEDDELMPEATLYTAEKVVPNLNSNLITVEK